MNRTRTTVYTPESSLRHPTQLFSEMLRDLVASRELAWRLAVRDISAQHRQTAIGFLWAIILPLANTLIWLFLKGSGIVSLGETALPYAVYVFTGTMLWAIFMDALNAPLQLTTAAKSMLAKIKFPPEALIVSGIYQVLFNAAIKIGLMLMMLVAFGMNPGWSLILFPLGVISLVLTGTVFGLLLTPVGMLYTDIGKAIPLLMQFLMYLTPVVFPIPTQGWAATTFELNPLTPLILVSRNWLTGLSPEYLSYFLLINLVMALLLFLVWAMYRLAMPILIERMSA